MKALPKLVLLLLLVIAPALATFGEAGAAESCHQINARGVGQQISYTETTATILGGGLLQGATYGVFGELSTITFTTNRGTLAVNLFTIKFGFTPEGQLLFFGEGDVTGTGKLAGATGRLAFSAVENMADFSFVETVTGNICIDLAP